MPGKYANQKFALLSVLNKNNLEHFGRTLVGCGYKLLSSGGTCKYLRDHGLEVVDVSEITGYPAVLGHRVVTLAPQVHGGLLATEAMTDELNQLDWPRISLLYVTFYDLQAELNRDGATFESCLEKTDIGGPTMVRSANKGGLVTVLTDETQVVEVSEWLRQGESDPAAFRRRLRGRAERAVAKYVDLSAQVYEKFAA